MKTGDGPSSRCKCSKRCPGRKQCGPPCADRHDVWLKAERPDATLSAGSETSFAILEALLTSKVMSLIMPFIERARILSYHIRSSFANSSIIFRSCTLRCACCARRKCCAGKSAIRSWICFTILSEANLGASLMCLGARRHRFPNLLRILPQC